MPSIRLLLASIQRGEPQAASELLPLLYQELRQIAVARLARESRDNSLQPTALMHEAWLKLVNDDVGMAERKWNDQRHFLAAASEAMRRILVDAARRRRTEKRGGDLNRDLTELDSIVMPGPPEEMESLNAALERLAAIDSPAAEFVNLRYFVGMTHEEAAEVMDLSLRSAERLWAFARSWLRTEMQNP